VLSEPGGDLLPALKKGARLLPVLVSCLDLGCARQPVGKTVALLSGCRRRASSRRRGLPPTAWRGFTSFACSSRVATPAHASSRPPGSGPGILAGPPAAPGCLAPGPPDIGLISRKRPYELILLSALFVSLASAGRVPSIQSRMLLRILLRSVE
jgi:hypothetical protein